MSEGTGEKPRPSILSPTDEWLSLMCDKLDQVIDRLPEKVDTAPEDTAPEVTDTVDPEPAAEPAAKKTAPARPRKTKTETVDGL